MANILGIDLGTDSIGWAIRNTDLETGPAQITHTGAVIFQKGVGEDKTGEFSLAAERTSRRSARKRYRRRWQRKTDLLSLLVENNMCPLPLEDLNQWILPSRKSERKYPRHELFTNWLRLDFDNNGTPEFENPYELRAAALEKELTAYQLGRILYHLTQRRGYLSNRAEQAREQDEQSGEEIDETPEDGKKKKRLGKVESAIEELENSLQGKTIGQFAAEKLKAGGRIRRHNGEQTNIHRFSLKQEFRKIIDFQGLKGPLVQSLEKLIFEQRPLKSQKGLIGKCIFETGKPRCPISHPEFELFRMWQVINNIKYSNDSRKTWKQLNPEQKTRVEELFYRVSKTAFPFSDIMAAITPKGAAWIFNYPPRQTVSGNPVCAGFRRLFGPDWRQKQWEHTQNQIKNNKTGNARLLTILDVWHWLFVMDNDKDRQLVQQKATDKLGLSEAEAKKLTSISFKQGYGSLSLKAIRKINYWLEKGEKYDKATFLANIPYMMDKQLWQDNEDEITGFIQNLIEENGFRKNVVQVVNGLIKQYNEALSQHQRFAGRPEYQPDEKDHADILEAIHQYLGAKKWAETTEAEKEAYKREVAALYLKSLQKRVSGDLAFIKMPRLSDEIKKHLAEKAGLDPKTLDKLYHPSETDAFKPKTIIKDELGREKTYLLSTPRTGSIRNPMAMRALFELRKLINYLLNKELIDENTVVMVEMARDLNDANMRKAIEKYQRDAEAENKKYEALITQHFNESGQNLPRNMKDMVTRYRLWEEQGKICFYTSNNISLTQLLDEQTIDIEHTIPRSLSFDDSLMNKTVAFKYYNQQIKKQLIPTQLPQYEEIEKRLEAWKKRVEEWEVNAERAAYRAKVASTKEAKDKAIQARHYNKMHLNYWKEKIYRFTCMEITSKFKNSQLVDTQIITRFGLQYLKTLFKNVKPTKGIVTGKIKKIWGAQSADEAKDRSRHTHHCIDAIIQTLLYKEFNKTDVYQKLAQAYHEAEQKNLKEPDLPNPWNMNADKFYHTIHKLVEQTIVFHSERDNTLKQTRKKIRERNRIKYKAGTQTPLYEKGMGIRASLHKDTFYGAVKLPERDAEGKLQTDENGRLMLKKDQDGNEIIKYRTGFVFQGNTIDAIRKAIENIVDDRLRELARQCGAAAIKEKGYFEIPPSDERLKRDPEAQPTRVYKVKVFAETLQNPLRIKQHRQVKQEHKQWYYVQTDGNYLMALYDNGRERDFELLNNFELAQRIKNNLPLYPETKEKELRGKKITIPLAKRKGKDLVLRPGQKVLLYEKQPEEITENLNVENLIPRLYNVNGLSIQRVKTGGRLYLFCIIQLKHHLEARKAQDLTLESGDYVLGDNKPFRKMPHNLFNGLIEGIDFEMTRDGRIHLIE